MRKFLLLIEGSGVSQTLPFTSIKSMSQYVRRNKDKKLVLTRYVWSVDHWERFMVFDKTIITHSSAIAIATMLASKTILVKAMAEGTEQHSKA